LTRENETPGKEELIPAVYRIEGLVDETSQQLLGIVVIFCAIQDAADSIEATLENTDGVDSRSKIPGRNSRKEAQIKDMRRLKHSPLSLTQGDTTHSITLDKKRLVITTSYINSRNTRRRTTEKFAIAPNGASQLIRAIQTNDVGRQEVIRATGNSKKESLKFSIHNSGRDKSLATEGDKKKECKKIEKKTPQQIIKSLRRQFEHAAKKFGVEIPA
jgi:hypothetical protein